MINESICVCQYWRSAQKWILIFFKLSLKCMHSHVVWQLMCVISLCTKVLILSPCILIDYENSLSNSCSIHVSREHMVGWVNWSTKLSWDKQTQIMTDWCWQNSWLNILRLLFYHLKCCCIFCLFQVLAHAMVVASSKPVLAMCTGRHCSLGCYRRRSFNPAAGFNRQRQQNWVSIQFISSITHAIVHLQTLQIVCLRQTFSFQSVWDLPPQQWLTR